MRPGQIVEVVQDVRVGGGMPSSGSSSSLSSPFKALQRKKEGSDGDGGGGGGGGNVHSNNNKKKMATMPWSSAWVELTAALKEDTPWAKKGHVVAIQSLPLDVKAGGGGGGQQQREVGVPVSVLTMPALEMKHEAVDAGSAFGKGGDKAIITIKGSTSDWHVIFGKTTGKILEYQVRGTHLLLPHTGGPQHAFLRALTDNDRAGFPVSATFVAPKWFCDFMEPYSPWGTLSYHARWKRLGLTLEGLRTTIHEVSALAPSPQKVSILVHSTISTTNGGPLLDIQTRYTIYGSKDIQITNKIVSLYEKQATAPLHLPRVGLSLQLPKEMGEEVTWFGLGPHETYADRKVGGLLDVHQAHVKDLHTPYVVPSENGGRSDVRWAALRNPKSKVGLLLRSHNGPVVPPSSSSSSSVSEDEGEEEEEEAKKEASVRLPGTFQFNASIHSVAELEKATHTHELKEWKDCKSVHVHIDHQHMGVGGDNTWEPDVVHSEFLIPCVGTWAYEVLLCPLEEGEEAATKACRVLE